MRAMIFDGKTPTLREHEWPDPEPGEGQLLIDGELAHPKVLVIPGHEIVGEVRRGSGRKPHARRWSSVHAFGRSYPARDSRDALSTARGKPRLVGPS
jgi:NADPH:quinone reductase-like Zn-dependent oxidoreductase